MRKFIPSIVLSLCAIAATATATAGETTQQTATPKPETKLTAKKAGTDIKAAATVLSNPEYKATAQKLIERKPENNAERLFLARTIVTRHLAYEAMEPLKGKEREFAKKHVIKLLDDAQGKEPARQALEMAVQLYTADNLGFKDEKKAVKLLERAVENDVPYAAADLAVAYAQGALGLKQDTAKALELLNKDISPRNANVLAFKATLLADPSSPATFDIEGAIAAARVAYHMNTKDEMIVSLLSGLLIANRANEAHVKEGHEILTQWTHRVRQLEAQEGAEIATKAVTLLQQREAGKIVQLPPGTDITKLSTGDVGEAMKSASSK